jgi:hypothetical protein
MRLIPVGLGDGRADPAFWEFAKPTSFCNSRRGTGTIVLQFKSRGCSETLAWLFPGGPAFDGSHGRLWGLSFRDSKAGCRSLIQENHWRAAQGRSLGFVTRSTIQASSFRYSTDVVPRFNGYSFTSSN